MSLRDSSTRTVQIVSGSSTCLFTAPNTFTYSMPASGYTSGTDQVALKSLVFYNSIPNISLSLGNSQFSYSWGSTIYSVVIPDGIFSFADIYNYLTQVMSANGHYLVNDFGTTVYYISLVVNPQQYALNLTCTPVPTSLPTGWTNPASLNLSLTSGKCPQVNISSGCTTLFGLAAASYPTVPQSTLFQINSGIPQITNVTSLNLLCNVVDSSGWALSPSVLASFSIPNSQTAGSLVQITPINLDWEPVKKQITFTTFTVSIVDQQMNPVQLRDPSGFVAVLNFRQRK